MAEKAIFHQTVNILKFDLDIHDIDRVASLIITAYGEDMNKIGSEDKTCRDVKRLIISGDNFIGHENIYVSMNDNDITGLCIAYRGNKNNDIKTILRLLLKLRLNDLVNHILISASIFDSSYTAGLGPDDFYISLIVVDDRYRKRGIANKLLQNAIAQAKETGCKRIVLEVKENNSPAISLYNKLGFEFASVDTSLSVGTAPSEYCKMEYSLL